MIAKRRIGRTAQDISDLIINTDLADLLPEHCDLLLKFIPSPEEVTIWGKGYGWSWAWGPGEGLGVELGMGKALGVELGMREGVQSS